MTALNVAIGWWASHGTRILGTLSSICAGLILVPDLIPVPDKPFWTAANVILGVLTIQRGNSNAKNLNGSVDP